MFCCFVHTATFDRSFFACFRPFGLSSNSEIMADPNYGGGEPRRGMGGPSPSLSASPYALFDPAYINTAPEFILPEGAKPHRGRLELAFSQIGGTVLLAGAFGGTRGLYNGISEVRSQALQGKVARSMLWTHVTKRGASTAQSLGTIALIYSLLGVAVSKIRGEEDQWNTLLAGTATGLVYRSTAGLRKCAIGGAVGLGLATLYCLGHVAVYSPDRLRPSQLLRH